MEGLQGNFQILLSVVSPCCLLKHLSFGIQWYLQVQQDIELLQKKVETALAGVVNIKHMNTTKLVESQNVVLRLKIQIENDKNNNNDSMKNPGDNTIARTSPALMFHSIKLGISSSIMLTCPWTLNAQNIIHYKIHTFMLTWLDGRSLDGEKQTLLRQLPSSPVKRWVPPVQVHRVNSDKERNRRTQVGKTKAADQKTNLVRTHKVLYFGQLIKS